MPVSVRAAPAEHLARAREVLGDRVTDARLVFDQVDVICPPERFVEVMTTLRDHGDFACRYFTFLSGVDRSELEGEGKPEAGGRLEVLTHVYSPDLALHVNVRVPVSFDNPVCPSITGVYRGAYWHERECHEMFGIEFEGHPRLANLYLPEDFEGHPLRRSFKLPIRSVKEWPGAKGPEEAAAGGR